MSESKNIDGVRKVNFWKAAAERQEQKGFPVLALMFRNEAFKAQEERDNFSKELKKVEASPVLIAA